MSVAMMLADVPRGLGELGRLGARGRAQVQDGPARLRVQDSHRLRGRQVLNSEQALGKAGKLRHRVGPGDSDHIVHRGGAERHRRRHRLRVNAGLLESSQQVLRRGAQRIDADVEARPAVAGEADGPGLLRARIGPAIRPRATAAAKSTCSGSQATRSPDRAGSPCRTRQPVCGVWTSVRRGLAWARSICRSVMCRSIWRRTALTKPVCFLPPVSSTFLTASSTME